MNRAPLTGQHDYYALFMRMPDGSDACLWDGEADDAAEALAWLYNNALPWMDGNDTWLFPVWSGEIARLLTQAGGVTPFWILRALKAGEVQP